MNSNVKLPLTLAEVLYEEIRADVESNPELAVLKQQVEDGLKKITDYQGCACDSPQDVWAGRSKLSADLVHEIYGLIRPLKRAALCLSGGGVRSATFNFGILQGLARCRLLNKFEYLSTVSGGGFIGSWLTAWIYREQQKHVADVDDRREQGQPAQIDRNYGLRQVMALLRTQPWNTPLKPEPDPVFNLRVYSNYLTPKKGLLSPDSSTLVAVYLRNLLLNWLVFVPAIMCFLMLPRIWLALVRSAFNAPPGWRATFGVLGMILGAVSLTTIVWNLPSVGNGNWQKKNVVLFCITPLILDTMFLSLYWISVGHQAAPPPVAMDWSHFWAPFISDAKNAFAGGRPGWPTFLLVGALIPGLPQLIITLFLVRKRGPKALWPFPLVIIGGTATGALTYALADSGLLFRFAAQYQGIDYGHLYACISVPYLLCLLTVGGTLVAGLSSNFSQSDDQEWWARCGAYMLLAEFGWALLSLIVMFGPALLINIPNLFRGGNWGSTKSLVATIVGIISGAASLAGGYSSKTPATSGKEETIDWKAKAFNVFLSVAAAIFLLFLLIIFVWLSDWALFGLAKTLTTLGYSALKTVMPWIGSLPSAPVHHWEFLNQSHWLLQIVGMFVLGTVSGVIGYFINTNRFSLHYYWRNRMMRTYLAASRESSSETQPTGANASDDHKADTRNQFTGFDMEDNIFMHQLDQKPLHVVDVTLNLVGGEKLEWQDRKGESFSISPLHVGSYWLGYRRARDYGGPFGISLGTSVAISGAAASPNMGYMMTSPIVRFIMTLFNVRLGFWLGNPGVAGHKNKLPTYTCESPRQSVRPIIAEALGQTNDESPYVYLSDGGHFENFGLYEMILRRCRLIVVGDGSSDTDYQFDSLALAIRQIRVDFGVPIDMGDMNFGRKPDPKNNYCALGIIRYSCVDKPGGSPEGGIDPDYDGLLVYLKPSLVNDEPRDVLTYHALSPTFPEESIADQWLGEAQFESYRELGRHMIAHICATPEKPLKPTVPDCPGEKPAPCSGTEEKAAKDIVKDKPVTIHSRFDSDIDELIKEFAPLGLSEFAQKALNHTRRERPKSDNPCSDGRSSN